MTNKNPLNLNKIIYDNFKINNYFNKTIFRIGLIIIIICFIAILSIYGFSNYGQISCHNRICTNPLFICEQENLVFNHPEMLDLCKSYDKLNFPNKSKEIEFLYAGEKIETKTPFAIKYFQMFMIVILLMSFVLNHIYYMVKKNGNKN